MEAFPALCITGKTQLPYTNLTSLYQSTRTVVQFSLPNYLQEKRQTRKTKG